MNKKIIYLIISIVIALSSCSDWTDTESLDINSPEVEHQNPALYKKYLESLRKYKESEHNVVYAWIENQNSALPTNPSLRVQNLPDSIDYIVYKNPKNLADWEVKEMESVRENKGSKFLVQIDFDEVLANHISLEKENDGSPTTPSFMTLLINETENIINAINQYNYDGLIVGYKGKRTTHMTEDEKKEYLNYQTAFMTIVENWFTNNKDKMLVFAGSPINVLYNFDFNSCKHIIIRTEAQSSANAVANELMLNITEGVPTDRYVVTAEAAPLDNPKETTGYWPNGMKAVIGTADWIITDHKNFNVVGIGIYNVNNDYYNRSLLYPTVRSAISTLNPSLK